MYVHDQDVDVSGRVYMSPTSHRGGEEWYGAVATVLAGGRALEVLGQGGDKGPA